MAELLHVADFQRLCGLCEVVAGDVGVLFEIIEELELHLVWKQWSKEHREENKAKSPWAFCPSVKYRIFFSSWRKTEVNNV